jgi:hypothetical protein
MKGTMKKVFLLFFVLMYFFEFFCFKVSAEEIASMDAPIQLYLFETMGDGTNSSSLKIRSLFLKQFKTAGFHILDDLAIPFISKTMERYGYAHGTRTQSSGIGYVHLSLTDGDVAQYVSDMGQQVILKSDTKSITWLFDQKKAIEMADKAGTKYALLVNITTQLIYQNDSPKPVFNIMLNANLYQTDNSHLILHHNESMVKLAVSAEDATLGSCQFLSRKLVALIQNNENLKFN